MTDPATPSSDPLSLFDPTLPQPELPNPSLELPEPDRRVVGEEPASTPPPRRDPPPQSMAATKVTHSLLILCALARGLHRLGWSRERAATYMHHRAVLFGFPPHECEIAWDLEKRRLDRRKER